MSNTTKLILSMVIGSVFFVLAIAGYSFSAKFAAEKYEKSLFAQEKAMKSTWGMMEQMLKSQGFTVKNYSKTFIDTIKANAKRYENDKSGMMKWVQEAQSQMSPDTHTKFMDTIEKVYTKKEAKQLSKDSITQSYETFLDTSIKGSIAKIMGSYPSERAKVIMDKVITTKGARDSWSSGNEEDVKDLL